MVLVRNRHTGKEKEVPRGTAEKMENELFLAKDWEVVKEGSPTPHEVVKFQDDLREGKDPQVLEFVKKDTPDEMIKKAEATIKEANKLKADEEKAKADADAKKAEAEAKKKADANAKKKEEEEKAEEDTANVVDLATLSVRALSDKMEYLNLEELKSLEADERKSVRAMVVKELKKREDEKNNPGAE